MYVFAGKKRELVWTLLGVLAAISVLAGILHNNGVVSGRTATMLIYGLALASFGLIAGLILWLEPDYVPRLADVPYPELRRALFFKASIFVLATLSMGIVPQERWAFSAFERFVIAAFGVFVLADWLAAVRIRMRAGRKPR
ncbi:hypothetical protein [Sinorhizobium sp. NFACC03]|uniref:hypothetical protein n=1 Tax=Sinorhizobium sp. NFACC03 TaxID=1566295 RepID=UPI000B887411|nr:hypothetical protein [Sinorhizobium sp. NFACC03]